MDNSQIFVLVFVIGVVIATVLAKMLQNYERKQQEEGGNR